MSDPARASHPGSLFVPASPALLPDPGEDFLPDQAPDRLQPSLLGSRSGLSGAGPRPAGSEQMEPASPGSRARGPGSQALRPARPGEAAASLGPEAPSGRRTRAGSRSRPPGSTRSSGWKSRGCKCGAEAARRPRPETEDSSTHASAGRASAGPRPEEPGWPRARGARGQGRRSGAGPASDPRQARGPARWPGPPGRDQQQPEGGAAPAASSPLAVAPGPAAGSLWARGPRELQGLSLERRVICKRPSGGIPGALPWLC